MAGGTSKEVIARGMRVLGLAIREQPRIFTLALTGSVLFGVLIIANSFVVGAIVGRIAVPALRDQRYDAGALALAAAALLAITGLRVIGIFGRRLGAGYMQFRLQAAYRRRVTRRYLELPLSWHQRHATGTLLSNANSDVEATWFPIAPLPFAAGTVVMIVVAMASLFVTDWALALVGLAIFPALGALNVFYSRRMAPRQIRAQRLRAEVSAIAHESFDGALVVKTMGREAEETGRFAVRANELRDALISVGRLRGLFDPLLDTLPSIGTLVVLLVGAYRLHQGAVSVAELVSVMFLFTVLAFPVRAIGWVLAEVPRSVAGWDRLQSVLGAPGSMPYGERPLDRRGGAPAGLEFAGVTFAYERNLPVLHDVSFTVQPGRTVALVGPTGAGKSTIASLAVRLVDPGSGTVRLDGVDARELTAASLAGTASLVPQVPFVFDDSVRANVTLDRADPDGRPLGDEQVWAALRLAQADGFVAHLPDALDTMVGERGTSLSGGQRQRLTLARALVGRPRLLVMDDATSAVDPRVEAAILAALRGADASASILVVAYRRATIALADEVVFVEHGRVVARGTHTELLATVPAYADLVTAYEKAEAEREREHAYDEDPYDKDGYRKDAYDEEVPA
ncbi:ABC transporter ATP-binding protein [Rhizomonospora bruguierae]|uniref:ABC transporter ATP-binding protein n=1 Tax=Rhizomonospora bruguierae TaxID=1581705 RepID=UPI0020C151BA|nr:ABC transporter ATP-binding protein [Micromonospora sp. NBRC 107566]